MIYLDNAATSFPKPDSVYQAMDAFARHHAGNPGRSGHALALAAQAVVDDARRQLAELFNAPDPSRIIFALNCTDALNIALKGLLNPGDHVLTTSMEHNAVVRPLAALAKCGVTTTFVRCDATGLLDPAAVAAAIVPATRLIVMSHASNVTGTIQPIAAVAELARETDLLFMVDAAQSAGCLPLDVRTTPIDLLAFPGHKSLLGPMGTGGLYVGERAEVRSFREGGTGTASESPEHPDHFPFRLEAGTANVVGIAGLAAGVKFVRERGLDTIVREEQMLTERLWQGLQALDGLTLYGPEAASARTSIVSFNLAGWEPTDVGAILDGSFDVAVRPGLHCAPLAHQTLGTFPSGSVRLSCGAFTTPEDVDAVLTAIKEIATSL
ncbi:MAG: aminotransferase class V-fold PLP-dependent enzyme [Armatimonadota bacterium]